MQYFKSSLDLLVKDLMSEDLKYMSKEYSGELMRLLKVNEFFLMSIWRVLKYFMKVNYQINVSFLVL